MRLKLWQVDAFTTRVFAGNPAAVVPLDAWVPDATLQAIAAENNLPETAFFVKTGKGQYDLRWFTPTVEVPLCGHATLASAFVLFSELDPSLDDIAFMTKSGVLKVERSKDGWHRMALPAGDVVPHVAPAGFGEAVGKCLGVGAPLEMHYAPKGAGGSPAPLGVWPEADVRSMAPNGALRDVLQEFGASALIVTAKGDGAPYDFLSRLFAPAMGIPEDPVTGSMNAALTPFWAERLGKKTLRVFQASPRGGDILCTDEDDRAILSGACALYLRGEIDVRP